MRPLVHIYIAGKRPAVLVDYWLTSGSESESGYLMWFGSAYRLIRVMDHGSGGICVSVRRWGHV